MGNPKEEIKTENETAQTETQQPNIPSIDTFWDNSIAGIINNEKYNAQKTRQTQAVPQPVQPQANTITELPQQKQEQQSAHQQTVINTQPQQKQQSTPIIGKIFGNNNNNQQTNNKSTQKPTAQTQKTTTQQTNPAPKIPQKTQTIANQPKQQTTVQNNQTQTTQSNVTTPQQKQTTQYNTTSQNQQKQTTQSQTSASSQNVKPSQNTAQNVNVSPSTALRPKASIDTEALKKEFNNYKVGLRNTIGRKVDFTKVIGDGECIVAFKIASNGKLTNRSFAKQSTNITLNDAVYSAIMATPSYNPPPSGYNNETLNLKIRFYSGNYDVSLY